MPMTAFEHLYRVARRFDHPLYQRVFGVLSALEDESGPRRLLDVGGRRSNYTIGLRSQVSITDIPRETDLQRALDLGTTDDIRRNVLRRRSNVVDYLLDDMTSTTLPARSFDIVVAVEVLEHVLEDEAFVTNVARVLAPGGVFVMTTPNGDFLPVPYPDHKRHYRKAQLAALLERHFLSVDVRYTVNHGRLIKWGVHKPSLRRPFRTLLSPLAFFAADSIERLDTNLGAHGKRHLLAVASQARVGHSSS